MAGVSSSPTLNTASRETAAKPSTVCIVLGTMNLRQAKAGQRGCCSHQGGVWVLHGLYEEVLRWHTEPELSALRR